MQRDMALLNYNDVARMIARMESPAVDNETSIADLREFLSLARAAAMLQRRLLAEVAGAILRFGLDQVLTGLNPWLAATVDLLIDLGDRAFSWIRGQLGRILDELF